MAKVEQVRTPRKQAWRRHWFSALWEFVSKLCEARPLETHMDVVDDPGGVVQEVRRPAFWGIQVASIKV